MLEITLCQCKLPDFDPYKRMPLSLREIYTEVFRDIKTSCPQLPLKHIRKRDDNV